jgi:hypothetical protein
MAEQDFGVNITCLVDGCKITINPSYGFWRYLQDALSSTFPTDSDAQDLAQAQMLRFYTEKLKEVSDGSVDYDTFISDIENSGYPFDNYILTQAQQQFENAQYNGFLNRIGAIFETGDGQAIQDFFDRYENSGIADNSFVIENSFSLMNPSDIINRAILGDGDVGVTVDVCTTPGQTNCVDPKAINDLWEDFGRHIRVIFKGLEIPGLPEWLPLPGIMRLPTIGEIWDKVTGPFTDAAREQLKDCMSKDDDGDGVNNTASYCMENRDIIDIITKGLEDGAGEIIDATTDAVGGIVDKALEGIDCVLNPVVCAGKIKDVIEGVLGGADPTQPGLPPWMRAIIIGSQYGDEVLKELEKIFNEDIDGDGTIGIGPTQEYCADGVTVKEDAEGTNCPEYAEFGYCTDGTTKKQDSAGTNCSDYVPDYGMCDDGLTKKEDAEGTNCPGPEPVVNEGDPCTLENEGTGTYQYVGDELQCIPDPPEFGFCQDGVTEKADAKGTNCDEYEGPDDGTYDPVCTEPRPTGQLTFALEEQQFAWDQKCRATHCESGVPISEDPDCYGPPPGQTCDNNAVNPDDCDDCGDGTTPDQHINGDCNEDLKNIDGTEGQCPADSERAGQNPLYDGRDTNKSGFFTTPSGITYTYEPCNPSLGFSIVGQDVNVCEDQDNLNYGNIVQQPEEPCGDCKPGFDKPEGYETCTSIVDVLCKDDNVSGNYEECKTEEPPEDLTCAQQGKVTNEDGSCGGCDTEKGYDLSELTGRCYIPPEDNCKKGEVRNGFGRCVPIGSECRAESFGGQDCRDPETNAYQFGVIDADGSCVCPGDIEEPPEVDCSEITEDNYRDCNKVKCPQNSEEPYADSLDQCVPTTCIDGTTVESGCKECPKGQELSISGGTGAGASRPRCVPKPECSEEDAYTDATKAAECGKVECPQNSERPYADSLDDCVAAPEPTCEENDPNSESDGQGGCQCKQDYALDNDQNSPTFGTCQPTKLPPEQCTDDQGNPTGAENYPACDRCPQGQDFNEKGFCVDTTTEECVTPDGTATGAIPPDCSECPTGQDFDTNGICVDIVIPPETCNDPNAVNNGEDGPCECKPGFTKNEEGLCFQSGDVCENGATVESGCDTCPDGTSVLEYEDGMCPSEPPEECANGATDYPTCTVCPEGQSMDAEGNCVPTVEPPPPETGGGGGGGMLGGGSFTPFLAGISYTPQAVPEPPAPAQKDYMAELDNIIKRSLFEGMA